MLWIHGIFPLPYWDSGPSCFFEKKKGLENPVHLQIEGNSVHVFKVNLFQARPIEAQNRHEIRKDKRSGAAKFEMREHQKTEHFLRIIAIAQMVL